MKITKKHLVVLVALLLAQLSAFAQYHGGTSDGAALDAFSTATCSAQPPSFFAYFGGIGDTAAVDELSGVTSCNTPPSFFAYMGGINDGAAVDEINVTTCGIPPSFFAYMGGTSDGAAVDDLLPSNCPFPPSFYAYFGGSSAGFAMDLIASCPITPPNANFTGTPTAICVGSSVAFTDTSDNAPSVWNWSFPGGTPATSTAQNPTVQYNTPGTYSVTLIATNFNGSNTKTITDYITVTVVPTVLTTTPGNRCDSGAVTLSATASAGTLKWYNVATGGTVLATGTSFITPSVSATTTYYVEAAVGSCTSARTAVIATVNTTPSITATTPNGRCDSGSVVLSATASAGTISWFADASGGIALGTGTSFATPILNATTTFYVQTANGTCISPRTAVIATVNTTPTVSSTTPAGRCDSGTVVLGATATAGTLNWYSVPTGGSVLGTGTNFTTPTISATTTFYVEAATATCTSTRTAVVATANVTPSIASATPGARCDAGTVILSATASAGTLNWFATATGGTALAAGNSFTTPSISVTTTYYVEAANGNCTSPRTPVVATVNVTPTITATTPANRCGAGTVMLEATASAGTISWYGSASGGVLLATGPTFSPTISATTTYYVETTNANCTSPRIAVTATVNELPQVSATGGSRCDAGIVNLAAIATSGTISWYNAATGGTALATGNSYAPSVTQTTTFYVESISGSCTSVRVPVTATIAPIAAPTGLANQTFCSGETVGMIVVEGANIVWYDAAVNGNVVPANTPLVNGTTYFASQTIVCESPRLAVTMSEGNCLGTTIFEKSELQVYPNPVENLLHISYTKPISKLEVYNMLGQLIYSKRVDANENQIDMARYSAGTYLIQISMGEAVETVKIIKK